MEKKKSKEEYMLDSVNAQIDSQKHAYEQYISVLSRFAFADVCTAAVYFDDLYNNALKVAFEKIGEAKLSPKERTEVETMLLGFWRENTPTELDIAKENLDYHTRLTSWAKHCLNKLPLDKKKAITIESIKAMYLWGRQFNRNDQVYKKLAEFKKRGSKHGKG